MGNLKHLEYFKALIIQKLKIVNFLKVLMMWSFDIVIVYKRKKSLISKR